ncbi:protein IQ-DOMAIN 14-like [Pistacia vera]|uniref:protein IQ-DOMAIN 14-like n=1 Tax=Pistacia vera TaxID=55513 RepID=UPI0012632A64|nr:protein IQ-DOMAIN 14-like [Pistacia vera]
MGKASKWMINFLLGRKDQEKDKKKDVVFLKESVLPSPTPPSMKRRWSFGRSSSKEKSHKSSKSLDLITTSSVVRQAISELQNQQINNNLALVVAPPKPARGGIISKAVKHAAATKIQAAYRSYLARKALCALRGLVKLQALVRGHIVRKKTSAALRGMHALMSIQVRARFQRLQMAEESQLVVKSQSLRHSTHTPQDIGIGFTRAHKEAIDTNIYETHGISKRKYGYLNHAQIGRIEHGVTTFFSGELSISKREHHQYEEISFSTAQNTPRHYQKLPNTFPGRASFSNQQPEYSHAVYNEPNYMSKTESSRAKARSHSEPKQRPKWSMKPKTTKRTASLDRTNVLADPQTQRSSPCSTNVLADPQTQRSSPCSTTVVHENQDPWFIKLYRSKRIIRDSESDANSTATSRSKYCNSLMPYEASYERDLLHWL